MKAKAFFHLATYGVRTLMGANTPPILATIILTDRCNLHCKHCGVNNITGILHPYGEIKKEMKALYDEGVRILFFCGGETFLWEDEGKTLRDLVIKAKEMGYPIVNVVTNGTYGLDLPEADLILLSIDGDRENHNLIRGETFDGILHNVSLAPRDNICIYMAVNKLNQGDIRAVADIAKNSRGIRAISFNFHTPYEGTEYLSLTGEEKERCCDEIKALIKGGYPVFNLRSALPYIAKGNFPTPCRQCLVSEGGKRFVCGRCVDIEGLCEQCGYFFAAEYSLIFSGKVNVIFDMLRTYLKYI